MKIARTQTFRSLSLIALVGLISFLLFLPMNGMIMDWPAMDVNIHGTYLVINSFWLLVSVFCILLFLAFLVKQVITGFNFTFDNVVLIIANLALMALVYGLTPSVAAYISMSGFYANYYADSSQEIQTASELQMVAIESFGLWTLLALSLSLVFVSIKAGMRLNNVPVISNDTELH